MSILYINNSFRGKIMKDSRTQTQKLTSSYITFIVITVSVMLVAMGVFAAKNNTMAIDEGLKPAMIYAAREDSQISVTIDESVYTSGEIRRFPLETAASLAPAPFGNIYILCQNVAELAQRYFNTQT